MSPSLSFLLAIAIVAILMIAPLPTLGCGNCVAGTNTFYQSLIYDETYTSFTSYLEGSTGVLPENQVVNPLWIANNTVSPNVYFKPDADCTEEEMACYVFLTFVDETSAYRHRVGVFEFNRLGTPGSRINVTTVRTVFPDLSKDVLAGRSGPCLPQGSTVAVGPFAQNASVGFFLDPDGACVGAGSRLWTIDDENLKSDTSNWNPTAKAYGRVAATLRVRPSLFFACQPNSTHLGGRIPRARSSSVSRRTS
jgi:hypothetical protein